ncbi:MAG: penicillin-binding protein [Bacteroidota bacterium]|nr:penicillin-binding protein [Bacteroidota bacterium]
MKEKKDILSRIYLVYVLLCVFSLSILYRIIVIQFVQGDEWKAKAEAFTTKVHEIEAVRGNIFDVNGALLATSLPYYEIGIDINAPSIDEKLFRENKDSLALCLHNLFKDKSETQYLRILNSARKTKDRYVLLQRSVSYKDLQALKKFPILRKGSKGGLVTLQTNKRERPFRLLAARTIGLARDGVKPVGLEGAFDTSLTGISGRRLMQKIAGDVWRPINDENEVEPKDGSDLYTTIDINIQDVAEHALLKALVKNNATHGCAVLMEVKTGAIKAIANLTKGGKDSTEYYESLNYAIGYPTEPGSTFKLASFLALLEDYNISLDEQVQVGKGKCNYYDITVSDSHEPEAEKISAQRVFETSSNVGTTKLVTKYFAKNPQQFVDRLNAFGLNKPLGLTIPGEGKPLIKQTKDKDWSGVTLPQMSYGYESLITPLQTLTLYNAIANNGKMVKPHFVKEIKRNDNTVMKFGTEIINEQIVKPSTIKKAKQLLEGVVLKGTGKGLNITAFKVGGKTGTAAIAKNGIYGKGNQRTYQASFVGYFPADNPLYTCIVIINSPSNGIYYGGLVAGPVFKEIAEKVYSGSLDFLSPINDQNTVITKAPIIAMVKGDELNKVIKQLNIPAKNIPASSAYVSRNYSDSTKLNVVEAKLEDTLKKGLIPNLSGLSAKDALYLLENKGLNVKLEGYGLVKKQSISVGQKFNKGDKIILTLS